MSPFFTVTRSSPPATVPLVTTTATFVVLLVSEPLDLSSHVVGGARHRRLLYQLDGALTTL